MQQVTVSRTTLIRTLEKNRAKHEAVYKKALDGYKRKLAAAYERVIGSYQASLKALRKGKLKPVKTPVAALGEPVEYLSEYDRAINMLRLHEGQTIALTAQEYDQYFRDEWSWKDAFTVSNSAYAGTALKKFRKVR